ncbi:hypothetical protein FBU30_003949 [Linnemannia zychae]|nr:hypothetical protein FBU30_003949 [Linnemannia zychae]
MSILKSLKDLFIEPRKTDDPKDWPRRKKNIVVFVIAYCAFVGPLGSSIYMPAVLNIKDDLNTTSSLVSATLSVYVLGLGIMPIFWAALTDFLGRRPIYLISMFIFIIGSIFAAISHNIWVFLIMRLVQSIGSSSVLAVGGGSLSDVFHSSERGTAFGLYYIGPLVAPMVGPIVGGVISDHAGWRCTMWLLLGTAVVAFLMVLLILPETYRHKIIKEPAELTSTAVNTPTRTRLHATHSDPTLVSSKSSLHEDSESDTNSQLDEKSGRLDKLSSTQETTPTTAMEYIVPYVVPRNVPDNRELEAFDSGVDSVDEKTKGSDDSAITTTEQRHVAFPNDNTSVKTVELAEADKAALTHHRRTFNPLRPFVCMRKPINALLITFNALSLGAQFCMNNTLPISFHELYGLSESTIGACFCAGGFGSVCGSILGGRYSDYVIRRWIIKQDLKKKRDQRDRAAAFAKDGVTVEESEEVIERESDSTPPEVRLQSVWLGVFILPLGLMLYGWSIIYALPLAAALVGIFLVGFGMMLVYASTTTTLVDANSNGNMATSAVACNSFARGVVGAIAGFLALPMESAMGSGWLYTFWALMTLVGSAGLVVLVFRAPVWRARAAEKALNRV